MPPLTKQTGGQIEISPLANLKTAIERTLKTTCHLHQGHLKHHTH